MKSVKYLTRYIEPTYIVICLIVGDACEAGVTP